MHAQKKREERWSYESSILFKTALVKWFVVLVPPMSRVLVFLHTEMVNINVYRSGGGGGGVALVVVDWEKRYNAPFGNDIVHGPRQPVRVLV